MGSKRVILNKNNGELFGVSIDIAHKDGESYITKLEMCKFGVAKDGNDNVNKIIYWNSLSDIELMYLITTRYKTNDIHEGAVKFINDTEIKTQDILDYIEVDGVRISAMRCGWFAKDFGGLGEVFDVLTSYKISNTSLPSFWVNYINALKDYREDMDTLQSYKDIILATRL